MKPSVNYMLDQRLRAVRERGADRAETLSPDLKRGEAPS
jgi:hypothetical protein